MQAQIKPLSSALARAYRAMKEADARYQQAVGYLREHIKFESHEPLDMEIVNAIPDLLAAFRVAQAEYKAAGNEYLDVVHEVAGR